MLNPLRYVVEVARCNSIRIAAENVNVAPSAISRHIHKIEQEFDILLFERNARGVTLTPAGEIYIRYAKSALLDKNQVKLEIDELKGLQRGRVRISTIDGIVSGLLSNAISSFGKRFPGVDFQILSAGTQMVTKAVRDREADIGISYQPNPDPEVETRLRFTDPLYLIVSPEHPLAHRTEIDFVEALEYPLALPLSTFGIRNLIDTYCRQERISIRPKLETNSIEALRGFARSLAGVSMLHYMAINRDVDLGAVVAIPFRDIPLHLSVIEICTQKIRPLPAAVERFTNHLISAFPGPPGLGQDGTDAT